MDSFESQERAKVKTLSNKNSRNLNDQEGTRINAFVDPVKHALIL